MASKKPVREFLPPFHRWFGILGNGFLVCWRVCVAVLGGYAAAVSFHALLSVLLSLFVMAAGEAVMLAGMLCIVVFLAIAIIAFATRRPFRVGVAIFTLSASFMLLATTLANRYL